MVRESVPRLTPARRNRVMSDFDSLFLRQYIVIDDESLNYYPCG